MKIKKGFVLREIAGSFVVVAVGAAAQEFNGMIRLNKSGAFLWKHLQSGANEDELVAVMLEHYDINEQTAQKDVGEFLRVVQEAGFVE